MSLAPFVWYERWLRFNAARSEHLSALFKAISIGTLCVGAWKESLLFSGEGEDSGYIPGARVSRGCWSAVKYTPFSNRETRVCWSAHTPSTSICVIEIADLYKCACSAVLFSCLKLGQQKLQNITPAGRRTRTTETPLQPWCSASYSLNRKTVASRIEKDNHQIQQLTKILLDGRGGAQRMNIPNLEGWNNCPSVAVTPGSVTNFTTELQQIFNHSIKLQHLNYMYRVLLAMVKSGTTAANGAKLDMLNMLLVSLQGQLELYLLAGQCTNEMLKGNQHPVWGTIYLSDARQKSRLIQLRPAKISDKLHNFLRESLGVEGSPEMGQAARGRWPWSTSGWLWPSGPIKMSCIGGSRIG